MAADSLVPIAADRSAATAMTPINRATSTGCVKQLSKESRRNMTAATQ